MAESFSNFDLFYLILIVTTKILLLIGIGISLTKFKIIQPSTRRTILKVSEHFLVPCMMFSNFIISLDIHDITSWGPTLILISALMAIGILCGTVLARYIMKDPYNEGLIKCSATFNATIQLPLILILSFDEVLDKISEGRYEAADGIKADERGIEYLMVIQLVMSMTRWIYGSIALNQDNDKQVELEQEKNGEPIAQIQQKHPLDFIKKIMNPPVTTGLIAIFVCLIPPLQNVFKDEHGMLNRVFIDSMKICGDALPPLILVQLGASLIEEKSDSDTQFSKKSLLQISFIKVILLPILTCIVLFVAQSAGLYHDPIIGFVVFANSMSPSAINLVSLAILKKDPSKFLAQLSLVQYIITLVTIPLGCFAFFKAYI